MKTHKQVIVVGGGASGIYASHLLNRIGMNDHLLIEANESLGGRVKQGLGNRSRPYTEIGAEIIHGDESILNDLIKYLNIPYEFAFDLTELEDPIRNGSLIYHRGRLINCRDPIVAKLQKLLEDMEENECEDDISVQQYLDKVYTNPEENREMSALVDCYMAKTDGSDLNLMSLRGILEEESTLTKNNYQFARGYSYKNVLDYLGQHLRLGSNCLVNTPVYKIEWDKEKNVFIVNDGNFTADHVIVTIPLKQLQLNAIQFVPDLPQTKKILINDYFTMEPAMKVILRFKKPIWNSKGVNPHKLVFVSEHPIIAQFWFSSVMNQVPEYVVTGLSTASKAAYASNNEMTTKQIIDSFLDLLFEIYGTNADRGLFIDGVVYDWCRDNPFVGGGYSSPKVRAKHIPSIPNPRACLGEPICFPHSNDPLRYGQLILSGEATSPGFCATVQGALESGKIAVDYLTKNSIHSKL